MSLRSLSIHTVDIVKAGTVDDLGRSRPSWTSGTTTSSAVPCVWQPDEQREQPGGAVLSSHTLYVPAAGLPSSLTAAGAAQTHRVINVKRRGVTVDAGPFDIVSIQDAAGLGRHWELRLLRVA